MPLLRNPPTGGILVKSSKLVNIQVATTSPNTDFEKLDLSDFLDLIKILTNEIISKRRRRINKNSVLKSKKQPKLIFPENGLD